jgi:hypothetical protein
MTEKPPQEQSKNAPSASRIGLPDRPSAAPEPRNVTPPEGGDSAGTAVSAPSGADAADTTSAAVQDGAISQDAAAPGPVERPSPPPAPASSQWPLAPRADSLLTPYAPQPSIAGPYPPPAPLPVPYAPPAVPAALEPAVASPDAAEDEDDDLAALTFADRIRGLSPALVLLGLGSLASLGFTALAMTNHTTPVSVLLSAGVVVTLIFGLDTVIAAAATWRAAVRDYDTGHAVVMALVSGISAIICMGALGATLVLTLVLISF